MKPDPSSSGPKKSDKKKGKAPDAPAQHPPEEVVDLGTMPETDEASTDSGRIQSSGPLSGTSVVTWDHLMRSKSEPDIHLDFDSLPDVDIDSASDRDLLKNLKFDEPDTSTLEHSSPADEFAEVGKADAPSPTAGSGDFSESSIFAQTGKTKRGDDSEVDLLGAVSAIQQSSFNRHQKTDEIIPPKIHGASGSDDVAEELGAALLQGNEGSAVDLGSEAIVDLPFPLGGDSAAKLAGSSRRRRNKGSGSSGNLDDSGAVDLLGSDSDFASVPGLTGPGDSVRRDNAALPSTRRIESTGSKATGWIGGGLLGILSGVAICTGIWLAGVLPVRPTEKSQTADNTTPPAQPAAPAVDWNVAVALLDTGNLDRAIEQLNLVDKSNPEARAALGQARVLKYFRDCKQKNAQPDAASEDLKAAQAELKSSETPAAALWLGLIEESSGKPDAARTIYQQALGKFGNHARLFQAALDRLDARPSGPASPNLTSHSFGAVLFAVLLQAEPAIPDEAGFDFWKAMRLAKQHKYAEAQAALKQARAAHDARRVLLARKGLNPNSDPLEETFLRCCDELNDYFNLRHQLHTGGYDLAAQTSPAAALTQALNRGKNDAEESKSQGKRLAAIKDALRQSGYDLNDLPGAVNKLVKAKESIEATVKSAQTDRTTAEARQQAAVAQLSQAEAAKKLIEDELKQTRERLAAMKPAANNGDEVAKLREQRQLLEARSKDLEAQLAAAKQSAERAQNNARELMNVVSAVKQKIQAPADSKPAELLPHLDRALAAKPAPRTDLPPLPTAVAASDPRAELAFARGLSRYRAGDLSSAETEFAAATKFNSLDARYWYYLGLAKAGLGRDAANELRQGVERERRNLPNAGTVDASLERLSPEARQLINLARSQN